MIPIVGLVTAIRGRNSELEPDDPTASHETQEDKLHQMGLTCALHGQRLCHSCIHSWKAAVYDWLGVPGSGGRTAQSISQNPALAVSSTYNSIP